MCISGYSIWTRLWLRFWSLFKFVWLNTWLFVQKITVTGGGGTVARNEWQWICASGASNNPAYPLGEVTISSGFACAPFANCGRDGTDGTDNARGNIASWYVFRSRAFGSEKMNKECTSWIDSEKGSSHKICVHLFPGTMYWLLTRSSVDNQSEFDFCLNLEFHS